MKTVQKVSKAATSIQQTVQAETGVALDPTVIQDEIRASTTLTLKKAKLARLMNGVGAAKKKELVLRLGATLLEV